jgi:hypothetical protein
VILNCRPKSFLVESGAIRAHPNDGIGFSDSFPWCSETKSWWTMAGMADTASMVQAA